MNARILFVLSLWSAGLVCADGRRIQGLQLPSDLTLPRDLQELVERLDRAHQLEADNPDIAYSMYLEILPELQEILDEAPNRVIEVERERALESLFQGVATRILSIYRALSPLALRAYGELFETPTRTALERAQTDAELFDLMRLHPLTTASMDAAARLGDRAFETGAIADALAFYNTAIRNAPNAAAVPDALLYRAAVASALSNDREGMLQRAFELDARGQAPLAADARTTPSLSQSRNASDARIPDAVMGGNNLHTWVSPVDALPGKLLLEHQIPVEAVREQPRRATGDLLLELNGGRRPERGPGPEAPFFPVLSGDAVYASSGSEVFGWDIESGRKVFAARAPRQIGWADSDHPIYYGPTIVGNRLYASMLSRIRRGEAYDTIPIRVEMPQRKVYAFDLGTGKLLYELGGAPLKQPKECRLGSFPYPPIVVGDRLLALCVLVEESVKIYVCAFEMQRGEMLWSTWLASGTVETTMFGEFAREPFAHQLAAKDGVVYAASGLGAVAAVDVATGQILWESTYEPIPIEKPRGYFPTYRDLGWHAAPPMLSGDCLVVAPVDSEFLYAYERNTGELLWRNARGQMTDLVGIDGGRVAAHSKSEAFCFDLEQGRLLWKTPLGGRPTGRGALAGGKLYVPLRGSLAAFDLFSRDGLKLSNRPLGFDPPGNLVVSERYLLFAGDALRVTRNQAYKGVE